MSGQNGKFLSWLWTNEGVAIEGALHKLLSEKAALVADFAYGVRRAGEVYAILKAAKLAYAGGQADYDDACRKLEDLVLEFEKALETAREIACQVGRFFEPPIAEDLLASHHEAALKLALETAERLSRPPEVNRA